jgi:hypothetical protein
MSNSKQRVDLLVLDFWFLEFEIWNFFWFLVFGFLSPVPFAGVDFVANSNCPDIIFLFQYLIQ